MLILIWPRCTPSRCVPWLFLILSETPLIGSSTSEVFRSSVSARFSLPLTLDYFQANRAPWDKRFFQCDRPVVSRMNRLSLCFGLLSGFGKWQANLRIEWYEGFLFIENNCRVKYPIKAHFLATWGKNHPIRANFLTTWDKNHEISMTSCQPYLSRWIDSINQIRAFHTKLTIQRKHVTLYKSKENRRRSFFVSLILAIDILST